MKRPLLTAITAILAFLLVQTHLIAAEDGAHGGANAKAADPGTIQVGQAVKAPRVTERYTDKGVTVDPVAFDIGPHGEIYVAEGSRAGKAVIDNRNAGLRQSNGVINDLKKTSVEDRLKQIKMLTEGGFYPKGTFTQTTDRVRLLKDTNGDGKADTSSIFADGFNDPLDGIASGVLYHKGKVYLTNIPHLWLLEDKDGDGDADKTTKDERVSLSYGWGIRWAFFGHDMHGLIKGPDGRIYFSIGDRGYNVTTKEGKHLYGPDRGAVFRMWPDGSGLELYFEGLRNPQELAFDNDGNLFTGDNNSDSGDRARFAYLPEGGDAGWRQDVQSLKDRGPWNREHMWKPRDVEKYGLHQPAWIIPPLKNVGSGPSGLAHYPGTGDVFPTNGSFLMCDYPRGIRHVYVKPDGATFKVVEDSAFVRGGTITDVAWGYDGRLYLSDWGGGWGPNPNGHFKTMVNKPAMQAQAAQIAEVKQLFADGFEKLSDQKLIELLGHPDQRVRIHAQWEAAGRQGCEPSLLALLSPNAKASELAQMHAIWAIGMRSVQADDVARETLNSALIKVLEHTSPRLRAQAAKTLGDVGAASSADQLALRLNDLSPVVRQHAAVALGKVGQAKHIDPLLDLLDRNNNKDVAIRHAASYGLSLIGDADAVADQAKAKGAAGRLGAVLALRRLNSPRLAEFLADADPLTAAEAVRAIYDKRVVSVMPALAASIETLPADRMVEPVMRRVIEANVRLADQASATRLARFAANAKAPEPWRQLGLEELSAWSKPRNREGVWGSWWPREQQAMDEALAAMLSHFDVIMANTQGRLKDLARSIVIDQFTLEEIQAIAENQSEDAGLRAMALRVLVDKNKAQAESVAKAVLNETSAPAALRIASRAVLLPLDQSAAVESYLAAYASGALDEKQDSIRKLAALTDEKALGLINALAPQLANDALPASVRLDVYEALVQNKHLASETRLAAESYQRQHAVHAEAPFIRDASLEGGSIERGKDVFFHHEGASCTQCHRLDNEKAQGPNLSGIGAVRDINYLYTAVVLPNADILEGYANGNGESDMKSMNQALSPTELRDLLAYLASLKSDPAPQYQAKLSLASVGPFVAKPASDLLHVILLPAILIGISAVLVVLLLGTILINQMAKP